MGLVTRSLFIGVIAFSSWCGIQAASADDRPHAVLVVGTRHYEPHQTLPLLAETLEGFGFRTTVVAADGNPEHSADGIKGLEALASADVAVLFLQYLTLPPE